MKFVKIKIKQNKILISALLIVGLFATVVVFSTGTNLAITVATKKPVAYAGSCKSTNIYSAYTNDWFTGAPYCGSGTYGSLNRSYSTGAVSYRCDTTPCYDGKSCRVCTYGSGNPCPWVENFFSPVDYRPCGGNHISTYNCAAGDASLAGCGDAFCGTGATGGYFRTGAEATTAGRCKGNNTVFNIDNYFEGGFRFHWQCQGPQGHTIGCGAYKIIDGACGTANGTNRATAPSTATELCSTSPVPSPNYSSLSMVGNTWYWSCYGANTGNTASCSANRIVNGSCGASNNSCTAGTLSDTADGSCTYNWSCLGVNGGTTSTCTATRLSTNGACSTNLNTCTAGTFQDTADTTTYNWNCAGSCGGTTAPCTRPDNCTIDNFTASPNTGNGPLSVTFARTGTNVANWYRIDYGDGSPSGTSLTHTYAYVPARDVNNNYVNNTYTARVFGRSPLGNECTQRTVVITVSPPPQCSAISMTGNPLTGTNTVNSTFTLGLSANYGTVTPVLNDGKGGSETLFNQFSPPATFSNSSTSVTYTAKQADIDGNRANSTYAPSFYGTNEYGTPIAGCSRTVTITVNIPAGITCQVDPGGGKSPLSVKVNYLPRGGIGIGSNAVCDMGVTTSNTSDQFTLASGFFYTYAGEGLYTVGCSLAGYSCTDTVNVKNPKNGQGSEVAP
jgi:hypothetical protein